jgi:predicted protein tyrosine phosphatase
MLFIDRIDEGLFICGVEALKKVDRLHNLGIKRILNVATSDLYTSHMCDGKTLIEQLRPFEPKIIGVQDHEGVNLSVHFEKMADFIEAGRNAGGVVVHCVAGQSRSATACISYLMIKQGLSLNSAWRKVYQVRNCIKPNPGFWKQLRELEAKLKSREVSLHEFTDDELCAQNEELEFSSPKIRLSIKNTKGGDTDAAKTSVFTAQVLLIEGVSAEDIMTRVQSAPKTHGVIWTHIEILNDCMLGVRARLVPIQSAPPMSPPYSDTDAHLQAALHAALGADVVKSVKVGHPLSAGVRVTVGGPTGGGRKAILATDGGDGTWNVNYEDGGHGNVQAFHLTLLNEGNNAWLRCCRLWRRCSKSLA